MKGQARIGVLCSIGLLFFAVAANATGRTGSLEDEIECVLEGEAVAGADRAEICEAFTKAIRGTGRSDVARVVLIASSRTQARASALDADGKLIAGLGYAIMDREVQLDSWQALANALARQLED